MPFSVCAFLKRVCCTLEDIRDALPMVISTGAQHCSRQETGHRRKCLRRCPCRSPYGHRRAIVPTPRRQGSSILAADTNFVCAPDVICNITETAGAHTALGMRDKKPLFGIIRVMIDGRSGHPYRPAIITPGYVTEGKIETAFCPHSAMNKESFFPTGFFKKR